MFKPWGEQPCESGASSNKARGPPRGYREQPPAPGDLYGGNHEEAGVAYNNQTVVAPAKQDI